MKQSVLLFILLTCQKNEDPIIPEIENPIEEIENPEPSPETDKVLSEIKLDSDGTGDTYELINSVFLFKMIPISSNDSVLKALMILMKQYNSCQGWSSKTCARALVLAWPYHSVDQIQLHL